MPASVNGASIESIVDTGTTIIVAPTSQARRCSTARPAHVPAGRLDVRLLQQQQPPQGHLQVRQLQQDALGRDDLVRHHHSGQCVLSVAGSDIGINAWITGDSWLQNTVAIFDTDNNRVGFANKA